MGEMRNAYEVLLRKSEGRKPQDLGIDGKKILKWNLKEFGLKSGRDSTASRQSPVMGSCE
jgi:hypothetical protein